MDLVVVDDQISGPIARYSEEQLEEMQGVSGGWKESCTRMTTDRPLAMKRPRCPAARVCGGPTEMHSAGATLERAAGGDRRGSLIR